MPHINQKVGLLQTEITNFAQQWKRTAREYEHDCTSAAVFNIK